VISAWAFLDLREIANARFQTWPFLKTLFGLFAPALITSLKRTFMVRTASVFDNQRTSPGTSV
jgi:hypothetical protein